MKIDRFFISLLFVFGSISTVFSQSRLKGVDYSVEAGAFVSQSSSTPFWLRTNQYGEVPLDGRMLTVRGEVRKEYDSTQLASSKKKLLFGYGGRGVVNIGQSSQVLLSEVDGKARYGAFEFYAGRRREIMGLVDSTLSMGSYIWSGNALPMPKLQIGLWDYVPILKNGLIAVKGNFAHGWFGSGDSTKNYFLHQKSLYVRLGKPAWRFKFYGGINHQVQWGGRPTVPFVQGGTNAYITQYGSGLQAFLHVALGVSLNEGYYTANGGITGEGGNRLGNHLGTVDMALEYQTDAVKWLVYRQSIYEDGSLFVLSNISDGLTGVSMDIKNATVGIKKIVVEYLDTSNQGGSLQSGNQTAFIPQLRGGDNYFNNATYEEGWQYKGQTIGTPFLMPLDKTTGAGAKDFIGSFVPPYAINPRLILNNRVKVWAVGIHSRIHRVNLLTRISSSQNLGRYYLYSRELLAPVQIAQVSLQQQITFPVKKYAVSTIIAYDNKGILEENLGFNLLIKRSF